MYNTEGDVQHFFYPAHQNVLTCQRCNAATVITTDKLQATLQQFVAALHNVLQREAASEKALLLFTKCYLRLSKNNKL